MAAPRLRHGGHGRIAGVAWFTLFAALLGLGWGQALPDEAGEALNRAQQAASQAIVTYTRHSPDHPLWQEALAAGRDAERLAPEHPAPQRFLAQAYLQIGWYARSWTAWERYLELGGPRDASVQQQLLEVATWMGINAFDAGRQEDALPFLETVLELDPEHLGANSRLAQYHLARGGPLEALPYLEAVEGRGTTLEDELAEARLTVRVGAAAAGAYAEAVEARDAGSPEVALQRALDAAEHQPNFRDAWRLAAEMARRLGRVSEAETYYGRLLDLAPDDAETHAALGALAFTEGDFEEATRRYELAVRYAPDANEYRAALSQSEAAALQEAERTEAEAAEQAAAEAAAEEAAREAAAQEEARRLAAAEEAARQAAEAEAEAERQAEAEEAEAAAEAERQAEAEAAARAEAEAQAAAEAEAVQAEEDAARAAAEAQAEADEEARAEAERQAAEQAEAQERAEAEAAAEAEAEAEAEAAAQAEAEAAAAAEEQARAEEEAAAQAEAEREAAAAPGRAPAGADEPLMIVDATVEHRGRDDGTPGAAAFLDTPWLTTDLQDRVDDVIHLRVAVAEKPNDTSVSYQLCLVPAEITIRPACTDAARLTVTEPGTYEAQQPWRELLGFGGIDWAQGVDSVMLVVREAGGAAGDQEESLSLPLTAEVQALSVAAGSAFPGWR